MEAHLILKLILFLSNLLKCKIAHICVCDCCDNISRAVSIIIVVPHVAYVQFYVDKHCTGI